MMIVLRHDLISKKYVFCETVQIMLSKCFQESFGVFQSNLQGLFLHLSLNSSGVSAELYGIGSPINVVIFTGNPRKLEHKVTWFYHKSTS